MYKIEKTDFGIKLTFGGMMDDAEMQAWLRESLVVLQARKGRFGVFVDMRTLKPLPPDAQATMVNGQAAYRKAGMARSVVILNNAATTTQFRQLAKASGISRWERYVDASFTPDWEQVGLRWIVDGVEPEV